MIPIPFGDNIQDWADATSLALEDQFGQHVQYDANVGWRDWVNGLYVAIHELGQEGPDPESFESWKDWAREFINTQKIWSFL